MEDPYRQSKPLAGLIAPDRRRQRAMLLVAGGMVAGALLFHFGRSLLGEHDDDGSLHVLLEPPPGSSLANDDPPGVPSAGAPTLEAPEIQRVVDAHREGMKRACWDSRHDNLAAARVTLTIIVGPNGDVVSVETTGSDALLANCLEEQSRSWKFAAHAERSKPINIPFFFSRQ